MDAETFIWLLLPMFAAFAAAVYSARRDHSAVADHEERLRKTEAILAYMEGAGSVAQAETPTVDPADFAVWRGQVKTNRETLSIHRQRLEALESGE